MEQMRMIKPGNGYWMHRNALTFTRAADSEGEAIIVTSYPGRHKQAGLAVSAKRVADGVSLVVPVDSLVR